MGKKGAGKGKGPKAQTQGPPAPPEDPPPLEEAAAAVAAGEAEPGPEMTQEEAAQLQPGDVADLGTLGGEADPPPELVVAPDDQADPVPRETESGVVASPTGVLRHIVLGNFAPDVEPVCGAQVSFGYRPNKWRDAEALIVAGLGRDGEVLIDLELTDAERTMIKAVPYGEGVGCWKFRE